MACFGSGRLGLRGAAIQPHTICSNRPRNGLNCCSPASAGGLTATFAACHDGITPICEAAMRPQALAHDLPLDQVDLEALDRFLISDRSPPDSMMLSDLDGFCPRTNSPGSRSWSPAAVSSRCSATASMTLQR